ncbi:MAG TPA: hypothetical protein PLD10_06690, partial [Rhodopila sp.]|nr:hypothetical protein [Rhodopila sp.]
MMKHLNARLAGFAKAAQQRPTVRNRPRHHILRAATRPIYKCGTNISNKLVKIEHGNSLRFPHARRRPDTKPVMAADKPWRDSQCTTTTDARQ